MRFILMCLLGCLSFNVIAQTEDEDALTVRALALDTNIAIAKRFSEAIGNSAPGYSLAFIDNETRFKVRYVYKNPKNESLRIDYYFRMEEYEDTMQKGKHPIVTMQRISGELGVITKIYNFLFASTLTPERVMASSTQGSPVKYSNGKTCDFSFLPDDYEPGYWVMTFTR